MAQLGNRFKRARRCLAEAFELEARTLLPTAARESRRHAVAHQQRGDDEGGGENDFACDDATGLRITTARDAGHQSEQQDDEAADQTLKDQR